MQINIDAMRLKGNKKCGATDAKVVGSSGQLGKYRLNLA